ncbi:MAG: MerR family DNA-binding transcriptional regulator [Lachnospiraceae bacterium]|nr:MerR family DNA-binding transcriptional regulator [Lachnospiraceae bacterium]
MQIGNYKMKIGEFAKKHNVTIDTIRHYISEGLLTPLRENTQYNFSEIDDDVLDSILLLKNMNFKLEEMRAFLLFQTMYTNGSFKRLGSFKENFLEKLKENKEEIKRLEKMNELIEKKLDDYTDFNGFRRGIALSMLSEFACPDCNEALELEKPELKHNEIISGELVCPKCKKRFYIRYGMLSDCPIDDIDCHADDEISNMADTYLEHNDDNYILNTRELFQKAADIVRENAKNAKNVYIDGESVGFLNSAILRSIPKDARLYVSLRDNVTIKYYLEDVFPKETLIYALKKEKAPFKENFDYAFMEDYDINYLYKRDIPKDILFTKDAKVDFFKAIVDKSSSLPGEAFFLNDLKEKGFLRESAFLTKKIVRKKESMDLSMVDENEDIYVQYGIYTFKTLG